MEDFSIEAAKCPRPAPLPFPEKMSAPLPFAEKMLQSLCRSMDELNSSACIKDVSTYDDSEMSVGQLDPASPIAFWKAEEAAREKKKEASAIRNVDKGEIKKKTLPTYHQAEETAEKKCEEAVRKRVEAETLAKLKLQEAERRQIEAGAERHQFQIIKDLNEMNVEPKRIEEEFVTALQSQSESIAGESFKETPEDRKREAAEAERKTTEEGVEGKRFDTANVVRRIPEEAASNRQNLEEGGRREHVETDVMIRNVSEDVRAESKGAQAERMQEDILEAADVIRKISTEGDAETKKAEEEQQIGRTRLGADDFERTSSKEVVAEILRVDDSAAEKGFDTQDITRMALNGPGVQRKSAEQGTTENILETEHIIKVTAAEAEADRKGADALNENEIDDVRKPTKEECRIETHETVRYPHGKEVHKKRAEQQAERKKCDVDGMPQWDEADRAEEGEDDRMKSQADEASSFAVELADKAIVEAKSKWLENFKEAAISNVDDMPQRDEADKAKEGDADRIKSQADEASSFAVELADKAIAEAKTKWLKIDKEAAIRNESTGVVFEQGVTNGDHRDERLSLSDETITMSSKGAGVERKMLEKDIVEKKECEVKIEEAVRNRIEKEPKNRSTSQVEHLPSVMMHGDEGKSIEVDTIRMNPQVQEFAHVKLELTERKIADGEAEREEAGTESKQMEFIESENLHAKDMLWQHLEHVESERKRSDQEVETNKIHVEEAAGLKLSEDGRSKAEEYIEVERHIVGDSRQPQAGNEDAGKVKEVEGKGAKVDSTGYKCQRGQSDKTIPEKGDHAVVHEHVAMCIEDMTTFLREGDLSMTYAEVKLIYDATNKAHDGKLYFDEFATFIQDDSHMSSRRRRIEEAWVARGPEEEELEARKQLNSHEFEQVRVQFDNGAGDAVTRAKAIMEFLRKGDASMTFAEVKMLLDAAHSGRDGTLSFDDFITFLYSAPV